MYTERRFSHHDKVASFPAYPTLASVFSRQPPETIEGGSALFWEGDEVKHVFLVAEGVLRTFKILSDGRRVITGFIYPGDLLGISLQDQSLYSAEAVTKVKLRRIRASCFHAEIEHSTELRRSLLARLCNELAATQDQVVLLACKTAEERVTSFLLGSARRLANDGEGRPLVHIPMTRQDMADYLGLTIETVSRTMAQLTRSGVIAATGRHAIAIRKPKALALLAGERDDDDDSAGLNSVTNVVRPAVWPHHA